MVAAATVGSTVVGGLISADSSQSAANTQANAATAASNAQLAAQQQALAYQQQQLSPYVNAGNQALSQYQNLLNGGAVGFDLSQMPGYQYQLQQAQNATNNSAAASIGALSGNAQQALQQNAQGLASTQFSSYLDRLAGLSSMGANAAAGLGNTGASIISSTGNNIASNLIGAGNATAAGQVASGNAIGSVLNSNLVQQSLGSLFGGSTNTLGTAAGASFDPYQSALSGGFIPQGL